MRDKTRREQSGASTGSDQFKGRRPRRSRIIVIGLGVATLIFVLVLPRILSFPTSVQLLVDRFAGLHPLKLTVGKVRAGWFTPLQVEGVELLDADGKRIARVGKVDTRKGLLSWIGNGADFGVVRISQLEASAEISNGTTNFERAFEPWLAPGPEDAATGEVPAAAGPAGSIELVDCKLLVTEAGRPEQWVMVVPEATVKLPTPGQLTGPVQVQAVITETSGTQLDQAGSFAAKIDPTSSGGMEVRAVLKHMPVGFWHLLRARVPEVVVDDLDGTLSGGIVARYANVNTWSLVLQDLNVSDLVVHSPELVGETPMRVQALSSTAKCALESNLLKVSGFQLACDFGEASAEASIPFPLEFPSVEQPFLAGANLRAQGTVDLPGLATAAAGLVPLRENTQLLAGKAQFSFQQELAADGEPQAEATLQIAGLKATASQQEITWQEPMALSFSANQGPESVSLSAKLSAEFARLNAGGSLESGVLDGELDLKTLHQRLSQWVALPIDQMDGSVQVGLNWQAAEGESPADRLIVAEGSLKTTPILLSTSAGSSLEEPAWTGNFACQLQMVEATPYCLQGGQLDLASADERLSFSLQRQLYFAAGHGTQQPALFAVDLRTDLANCTRRGSVWLAEPPEVNLNGQLQLAVNGALDLTHVEISDANWGCEPLIVKTPQLAFSEPKLIGKFQGRIDTSDLTRLIVDVLQVQSTSFSIGAEDQAKSGDRHHRVGQAMWRVDLNRLMRNVATEAAIPGTALAGTALSTTADSATAHTSIESNAPAEQLSAAGMLQGQLAWEVSPEAAGFNTRVDGQDIRVWSQSAGEVDPQELWMEKNLVATLAGTWTAADGQINVQKCQLQSPWLNYDGRLTYWPGQLKEGEDTSSTSLRVTGQAAYDATQLSQKLRRFTGDQVHLEGQQTVPVDLNWTMGQNNSASVLAGLNLTTVLGWESGSVAGVPLGKAEVPIKVAAGQLQSAAEIPVSGGALRWDFASNLAEDQRIILQQPTVVLDHVQITDPMCKGWLKYLAPLLAEATSVDGRLSLKLNEAALSPTDPMQQSVTGEVVIHEATVGPSPFTDQIILLAKQIDAIRKQDPTQMVSNSQKVWLNMPEQRIAFELLDGRVEHRDLKVRVGDATISTAGSVALNGQMKMQAALPIPDDWAEKSPWLAGLRGQVLQFPIHGTLSDPKIDSQLLSQVSQQTVRSATDNLLREGWNRGLEKLLGGQDNGTVQDAANPHPLQGLGDQILKGQILKGQGLPMPGIFPGLDGQPPSSGK